MTQQRAKINYFFRRAKDQTQFVIFVLFLYISHSLNFRYTGSVSCFKPLRTSKVCSFIQKKRLQKNESMLDSPVHLLIFIGFRNSQLIYYFKNSIKIVFSQYYLVQNSYQQGVTFELKAVPNTAFSDQVVYGLRVFKQQIRLKYGCFLVEPKQNCMCNINLLNNDRNPYVTTIII
ncbi:Hypothetical_protein [Hexamita inflata]|uniref:Hypothetical_protein n=1 Tax=Hexamita inflata TaxID=28002 RepID=A0AA86R289_9EUKA|nr:Hypothetical protein HINF_LOCUS48700 [Hexamita inflata]